MQFSPFCSKLERPSASFTIRLPCRMTIVTVFLLVVLMLVSYTYTLAKHGTKILPSLNLLSNRVASTRKDKVQILHS